MARKLPIGAKIGKVWGWTKPIFQSETTEVQHLRIKAGTKCSDHEHSHKHNLFYVLTGRLKVIVEKDGLQDETILDAGESTAIRPGDKHRFEAVTDCEIIELYWVTLDPDDIRRYTHGGAIKT
jgi:mannose-6-phosphate isomerase-like protein (cupin superfamily)